ncbi:hypothetical protein [Enterococcus sp. HY326]|uniref:hypothetical protein n=1 Tax=Enterococcus sp. HY326 TaxID=2971265 RepID=UPI00223EC512|nr:hypothetical protein [Enterococcus sp. HY326]
MNTKGIMGFYFIAGIGCGGFTILLFWRILQNLATVAMTEIALAFLFLIVSGLAMIQFKMVSAQLPKAKVQEN